MSTMALALLAGMLAIQDKADWAEAQKKAKESRKLAMLIFVTPDRKACVEFKEQIMADANVKAVLNGMVVCQVHPLGTDAENELWQKNGSATPPMMIIFDPDGAKLMEIGPRKLKYYLEALDAVGPAYQKMNVAKAALAKDPNAGDAHATIGEAWRMIGNPKESAASFDKATELLAAKDKAAALKVLETQLGGFYEKGWYKECRIAAKRLSELDASDSSKLGALAALTMGLADGKERKFQEAIAGLKVACERFKDHELAPKLMIVLGNNYEYAKDPENAKSTYGKIMTLWPDSETAITAEKLLKKLTGQ